MDHFQGKRDFQVQGTNDRATLSKSSTVTQGYYEDKFLQYFVSKSSRRAPIIHRLILNILKGSQKASTVNLLRMNALRGTKTAFLTPKGYDKHLPPFYVGVVSPSGCSGCQGAYLYVHHTEDLQHGSSILPVCWHMSVIPGVTWHRPSHHLLNILKGTQKASTVNLLRMNALRGTKTAFLIPKGYDKHLRPFYVGVASPSGCSGCQAAYLYVHHTEDLQHGYSILPVCWHTSVIPGVAWHRPSNHLTSEHPDIEKVIFLIGRMNHFKHPVGAPLHATEAFPTRQSQIQRFMKEGWPLVHCPTLNFFYYDTLPEKEKARLQDLEPFDEFEEWHLMCSHYIVLSAFKGSCQDIKEELFFQHSALFDESAILEENPCSLHTVDVLPSRDGLKRFGHTATPLSDSVVLLTGGFGLDNGKHMRLNGVQLLRIVQGVWHCTDVASDSEIILGGRIFHSATKLNDNNILIHGGRTSPAKPCAETLLLSLKDKDESQSSDSSNVHVNCRSESERKSCEEVQDSCEGKMRYKHTILSCQGDIPQPRWRHSATRIVLPDGMSNCFVF
ncbi:tRNA wybutosine-synthesizing protein 4-like [Orbicella faveolata]|uniref:tRNA wybutosine-synthesizing protein 4-like n=1 Tax=Orbicella faveolata TaxID=48498 RepID=UPI0009E530E7|nr:tRNA wybutosine-synthesizing protein 4-like [Orbicella faveolata]